MGQLKLLIALFSSSIVTLNFSSAATEYALGSEQTRHTNRNAKHYIPCLDGCRPLNQVPYYYSHSLRDSGNSYAPDTAKSRSFDGRSRHLGSPVDLVVAHCCERLARWVPALVARHPGAFARVIVYSKCTRKPTNKNSDCNASAFLESWDRFKHKAQQADRRAESLSESHNNSINPHSSLSSNTGTSIQNNDGTISLNTNSASDGHHRLLRKQSLPTRSHPTDVGPLARKPSQTLLKRQASNLDEPVILSVPPKGYTYLPPPLSIVKVVEPSGGRSTDECGAYLTHLSKISRSSLRHANSQTASPLIRDDSTAHLNDTVNGLVDSGMRTKEASGALLVHGLPSEHWNLTLVDALLQLAVTSVDQRSKQGQISSHERFQHQHHPRHQNGRKASDWTSMAAGISLRTTFLSLTMDMMRLSEWPGNSMAMTTGGCMRSLVSAAHPEPLHSDSRNRSSSSSSTTLNYGSSGSTGDDINLLNRWSDRTAGKDYNSVPVVNQSDIKARWEASAFVSGLPSATAYSNAMFFVGYDVIRRRPPQFWEAAREWIFWPDLVQSSEHSGRREILNALFSEATREKTRAAPTLERIEPAVRSRAKDCEGSGRRRKGKTSPLECRLLERTWHTLFCQPCTQPPREMDARLPPELRLGTRAYHPPALQGDLSERFSHSDLRE